MKNKISGAIFSLLFLLAFTLGTVNANGILVSPATYATPGTQVTVAATTIPVQIFAGNANLNGWTLCNSSTSDAYFNFGTTATLGVPFWQHYPGITVSTSVVEPCFTMYGVSVYRGPIWGIWTTANGYAVFTWW